jgi:hypothetical protein
MSRSRPATTTRSKSTAAAKLTKRKAPAKSSKPVRTPAPQAERRQPVPSPRQNDYDDSDSSLSSEPKDSEEDGSTSSLASKLAPKNHITAKVGPLHGRLRNDQQGQARQADSSPTDPSSEAGEYSLSRLRTRKDSIAAIPKKVQSGQKNERVDTENARENHTQSTGNAKNKGEQAGTRTISKPRDITTESVTKPTSSQFVAPEEEIIAEKGFTGLQGGAWRDTSWLMDTESQWLRLEQVDVERKKRLLAPWENAKREVIVTKKVQPDTLMHIKVLQGKATTPSLPASDRIVAEDLQAASSLRQGAGAAGQKRVHQEMLNNPQSETTDKPPDGSGSPGKRQRSRSASPKFSYEWIKDTNPPQWRRLNERRFGAYPVRG